MIATLKMSINPKNNKCLNYNVASLLHGVIMEMLDPAYCNFLHKSSLKPFTQYIIKAKDSNKYIWTINTLNLQAYEKIIKPMEKDSFNFFKINYKDIDVIIEEKQVNSMHYKDLINKFYIEETPSSIVKIRFITPTAFKSMGEYCFIPSFKLLYKSIMNKYDTFSNSFTISSDEVLETLVEKTKIVDYALRSARFHLEGTKIPSFIGEITLKINGPETMISLVSMLFEYSKWCGIGIKTALGMGAVDVYLTNKMYK